MAASAGQVRTQYQHITDLLPTLSELCGVEIPATKAGAPIPAPAGASFTTTLADGEAASTHPEQYYEMIGHRGFYRDGWSAVTCRQPRTPFSEEQWELHDLRIDPTESRDLAAVHPDRLVELQAGWEQAAWANQVFPLDEGNNVKGILRPPWDADLAGEVRLLPGTPQLERWRSLQLINFRTWAFTVAFDWQAGQQGTLVAHGDQGGGYGVYVVDGRVLFVHNGYGDMTEIDGGALSPGAHELEVTITPPERLRWDLELRLDATVTAEHAGLVCLTAMAPFQGIDVGVDRRSPVSWRLHERYREFPYTGAIDHVTYRPGELSPFAGSLWLDVLKEAGTKYE